MDFLVRRGRTSPVAACKRESRPTLPLSPGSEKPKLDGLGSPSYKNPVRWTSKSVALPQPRYDGLPSPSTQKWGNIYEVNVQSLRPAGFRGLHPDLPVRVYHRHLPHWRQDGATYFVTFRLHDSIPQHQLQALKRWRTLWEENHPEPRSEETWSRFASEITARTDRYLDQGYGECVFQERELADVMAESMLKFQNQRYLLSCFTVMPNHIHLAICPQPGFKLEELMQAMKGYVARKVNRILGRCGRLWEQESYDRIIRDEEHLWRVVQYIGNNACAAGLARRTWKRWIHEQWQQSGWKFIDQVDEQPKTEASPTPNH